MGEILLIVVPQLIGIAVGSLLAALLVQLATRLIAKYTPPYGMAYLATLLGTLVAFTLGFIVGLIAPPGDEVFDSVNIGLFIVGFFIQSAAYGMLIKDGNRVPLGFGRGALVALTQLVMVALILALLVGSVYLIRALL